MALSIFGKTKAQEVIQKRTKTASLLDYASTSRNMGAFNDVTIKVEKESIQANKMVLSCYSQYFEKLFWSDRKKKGKSSFHIDCVDATSLKTLVEFIYTGVVAINSLNVCSLVAAAHHLQIEDIKPFLFEFLGRAITPDCCSIVLTIAELYRADALKEYAVQFLCNHFNDITNSREFKKYASDELRAFINSQNRNQLPEIAVYNALIKWTKFDITTRAKDFLSLFTLVNLNKIPFTFLEGVVAKENLVIDNRVCSKLLIEAFSRQTSEMRESERVHVSKILNLGGRGLRAKVVEVLNHSREEPKSYPDLPGERSAGCAVAMHGYIYFVGGLTSDQKCSKDVWRLNRFSNHSQWEAISPMLHARHIMGSAVFHNSLVVVGGWDNRGSLNSGEYYSEIVNSWKPIRPMTQLRSGHCLVVCYGSLFAIGGFVDDGKYLSSVERLQSVRGEWVVVAPMTMSRFCFAAVQCGGFIYAIGGQMGKEVTTRQKSAEKYDLENNFWVIIEEMHFKRSGCDACVLDGKIFVIGGVDPDNRAVREIERYDPDTNTWMIIGKTNEDFIDHSLVAV